MSEIIRARLNGPGLGLIITAALGILLRLLNLVLTALGVVSQTAFGGGEMPAWATGAMGMVFEVVAIGLGAFLVFGGMKMRALQSHGLCVAAAVLAIIPCTTPCCLFTLPVGIWALVVLLKPEVKEAFTS